MNTNECERVGENSVCDEIHIEKKFDIKTAKNTFKDISFGLFIAMALMLVILFVIGKLAPSEIFENAWITYSLNFVVMYVIAFPIAYLFVRGLPKYDTDVQTENKMNTGTFVRLFISAAFLMYVGNIIGTVVTGFFTFFKYFLRDIPSQSFTEMFDRDSSPVTIIYVAVIAPIFEEIVFRKVIIDRTKRFGYMPAIIFSGVAFGFFHGNFFAVLLCDTSRIFAWIYLLQDGKDNPHDTDALSDKYIRRSSSDSYIFTYRYRTP